MDATQRISPGAEADAEARLVARLKAGEPDAFEHLLREEGPRMLALAERYLRDRHEAEDALQDAFLNVARSIAGFEGTSRLRTWLHRVVVNCALMRLRSSARRLPLAPAARPDATEGEPPLGPARAWGHAAADLVAREDLRRCVQDALGRLGEADRTLLALHDIQGMTLDELAQTLDIGRTTVKTHLHRARHALRAQLDERLRETHP